MPMQEMQDLLGPMIQYDPIRQQSPQQKQLELQQKAQQVQQLGAWDKVKFGINEAAPIAKDFWVGTPNKLESLQRFAPYQQNAMYGLLGMGMQGLQNPYQGFEPIAKSVRQNFEQNTLPSLAERFTSMGKNSMTSPLYMSQMHNAGANLDTGIGALQAQYGLQNQQNMGRFLQLGLQPQYEHANIPGQNGLLQYLLQIAPQLAMLFI